jgi:hypothetical protein
MITDKKRLVRHQLPDTDTPRDVASSNLDVVILFFSPTKDQINYLFPQPRSVKLSLDHKHDTV